MCIEQHNYCILLHVSLSYIPESRITCASSTLLRIIAKLLSQAIWYPPTQRDPTPTYSCQHLMLPEFLNFSNLINEKLYLIVAPNYICMTPGEVNHLFICLFYLSVLYVTHIYYLFIFIFEL